jgi:polyisoprenoid-binding protein YceI
MGLTARIRTRDGWAVSHAVVTLTDGNGAQALRAEADSDGVVRDTTTLAPGGYTVIVTAVGYAPAAASAIVTASGRADIGTVTLGRQGGSELPPPGPWTVDPAHSSVAAIAQHLGISSVRGRFTDFTAAIEIAPDDVTKSRVEAVIRAASIDTGNTMRDDHMRSPDFLDVATYPLIEYAGTGATPQGGDRWTVDGELTLRGTTRPVPLDLTYLGTGPDPWGGQRAAFRATTELHRKDFAIDWNQPIATGAVLVGWVLKVVLDIEAVQGDLPA